jgi:radical SAM protein with 4Fe4S-binding SPASM domain
MGTLMAEINARALQLGVPLSVHLDVTWRCNERCIHCYLDHDDCGELATSEIRSLLDQLAEAGVLFLSISGGEPLVRPDLFDIIEHARGRLFNVKLKTNAILIGEREAARLRELGVEQVQVSIYSHRPEVHDGITKVPGSLDRSLSAIRFLRAQGLKVAITNILMKQNVHDHGGVRALAAELGATCTLDPTVTPHWNGGRSLLDLNISREDLREVLHNPELVGRVEEWCAPPPPVESGTLDEIPCSAGHTFCYISPCGEVYPCVQVPIACGNVRERKFEEIWRNSPELKGVRSIRNRDLTVCSKCGLLSTCTRCPGLAYMEGDLRGPSTADCEKSFARTGVFREEAYRPGSVSFF